MKTTKTARSVRLPDRRTTIELEDEFWDALYEIAGRQNIGLDELAGRLDQRRGDNTLTTALRVYAISYYRSAVSAQETGAATTPRVN